MDAKYSCRKQTSLKGQELFLFYIQNVLKQHVIVNIKIQKDITVES